MTVKEEDAWRAILKNGRLAVEFAGDLDEALFLEDLKSLYAVVRSLEIVSEASRRLRGAQQARFPDLPWRQIEDSGNEYRHGYHRLDARRVWRSVHQDLPALMAIAEHVCRELPD